MKKVLAFFFALLALPALAQTYPTKPVRIIVPFTPGGGSDFIGRFIAQRLSGTIGAQVIDLMEALRASLEKKPAKKAEDKPDAKPEAKPAPRKAAKK